MESLAAPRLSRPGEHFARQRRSLRQWCLEALITLGLATALLWGRYRAPSASRILEGLELRSVDARFWVRGARSTKSVSDRLAIIGMDDSATQTLGYPLPRATHAALVDQLHRAGAAAIIFDIIFADNDRRRPADDQQFATACARAGNVFLPFDDASARETSPQEMARLKAKLAYPLPAGEATGTQLQPPIEPLLRAMQGGGHVATAADIDNVFRSAMLLMVTDAVFPHVAVDAVRHYWQVPPGQVRLAAGYLVIGSHRIGPLQRRPLWHSLRDPQTGQIMERQTGTGWMIPLNFLGGHDVMQELTIPYLDALQGRAGDRIKGRIVIIGATANGTTDLRPSPFDPVSREFFLGVETNATLIANLLDNDFLHRAPLAWAIAATMLTGLLAGLAAAALRPWLAALVTGAAVAGYTILATIVFTTSGLVLELVGPLCASFVCFSGLTTYRLVFVDREAREYAEELDRIGALTGQYVNERIVEELLHNPAARSDMAIGTRREVTVLFSDIRSFTAWSERNTPEEVKARLDEYFPAMCEIVQDDYDGYIDKYIGDALMGVWNVVYEQPDHAARAVHTALSMQRSLAMLNQAWRRQKQEEFHIGIGIATGPAIWGSFGSSKHKLMPTVLGDTVNLASRLESVTKETGNTIIISAATYAAVKDDFETKSLGVLPIRGKSELQEVYTVLAPKSVSASEASPP